MTTHKLLEYLNKHTGRNVEYTPSLTDALTVIGVLIFAAVSLISIFFAFKSFWLNPKVWLVGSLIIYVVCSAGVIFNIIHNIPMTTTNNNGETKWFSD